MSKDAQPALAMPDRLVPMADLDPAQADPAAGADTPQALELRHLRYFVALADAGSFTRAAEKVFVAQPTLSQQIRRLEEIVGTPLLQRRREGLRLTPAGRVLLDGSRTALALVDQEVSRTRQAAGLGRPRLRVVIPPGLPESLAVPATARLRAAAAAADADLTWLETVLDAEFSLITTRRADAGLGWLTARPETVPAALEVMTVGEFEPEVWIPATHAAARSGTISLEELAALQVIHGPRRAHPGIYDAWVAAMRAVDPRFEFTDPPFRHSLAMTLALAAAGNRPAAVLTGPAIAAPTQAWPIRRSRLAGTYGMVRVILQHHPLTAAAALVWNGDLPRPLQQMLFDAADSLTEPPHPLGLQPRVQERVDREQDDQRENRNARPGDGENPGLPGGGAEIREESSLTGSSPTGSPPRRAAGLPAVPPSLGTPVPPPRHAGRWRPTVSGRPSAVTMGRPGVTAPPL